MFNFLWFNFKCISSLLFNLGFRDKGYQMIINAVIYLNNTQKLNKYLNLNFVLGESIRSLQLKTVNGKNLDYLPTVHRQLLH